MAENRFQESMNVNGLEEKTPFLIGVAGGTASGKVKHGKINQHLSVLSVIEHCVQKDNGEVGSG